MRARGTERPARKKRLALIVIVGVLAAVLSLVGSGRADPPSEFVGTSDTCPAGGTSTFLTLPVSGNHSNVLVQLATDAGPGTLAFDIEQLSFAGPDVVWAASAPLNDGDRASGEVTCRSAATAVPYRVSFYDVPTTPAWFSGAGTPTPGGASQANTLLFVAPSAAHYVADVYLSQGAVTLDDGTHQQAFAWKAGDFKTFGSFDLGLLAPGRYRVLLTPQPGLQARWELSIHEPPVALSGLAFDREYERPTQTTTAHYVVDGAVTLTATILNAAQQPVRSLVTNAPVAEGAHSLTWDGLDDSGLPVMDGSYTMAINYTDTMDNSGQGQASIVVDGTPPTVAVSSAPRLARTDELIVDVFDDGGVKTATLRVDGTTVETLGPGEEEQLSHVPTGGWRSGRHSFSVSATDNAGNTTRSSGSFSVPAPRVYAPDCRGKPRFKPTSISLTCARNGVWVGKVQWSQWTTATATGVGVYNWNDCAPSCRQGHAHSRAGARVKVYRVARCKANGLLEFTRVRITPPASATTTLGGKVSATRALSCTSR